MQQILPLCPQMLLNSGHHLIYSPASVQSNHSLSNPSSSARSRPHLQNVSEQPENTTETESGDILGPSTDKGAGSRAGGRNRSTGSGWLGNRLGLCDGRCGCRARREDAGRRHGRGGGEGPVGDGDGLAGCGGVGDRCLGAGDDEGGAAGADGRVG